MEDKRQSLFDSFDDIDNKESAPVMEEKTVTISIVQSSAAEEVSEPCFEESMQRLEQIVRQLERGELSLEESLTCFEEGIALVKRCQKQLDRASEKIQILTEASSV